MSQPAEPVDLAVALVNTYDLLEDPPDLLRDLAFARRVLDRHGYPEDAAALAGLDELRAGRDRLRAFFHAEPGPPAAAVLNALLADTGAVTRLEPDGTGWRVSAGPAEPGVRRVVAIAAAGLAAFVAERGFARIGTCAGAPCDCAFVDRTRPGTRRYCCTYCADRVAAADYRRRKKASG